MYVKIDQHVKVNKKKLLLSDIASVHCGKHDLTKELSDIMVFQVPGNESGMYAMTFIKIVELIHRKRQDVTVVNEGEKDFIIEYMPEKKKKNASFFFPTRGGGVFVFLEFHRENHQKK